MKKVAESGKERDMEGVLVARDIYNADAIRVKALDLKSLQVGNDIKRQCTPAFSHIVGYTGTPSEKDVKERGFIPSDISGKTNLEAYYDDELHGQNGRTISFRDSKGNIIEGKHFASE